MDCDGDDERDRSTLRIAQPMIIIIMCEVLDHYQLMVIIVIIVVADAVGGGRWVFTVRQTIRATCGGYHPRMYFSRMPRRLANVKNRFPGVKINTPPNDRAATGQSSPPAAHAAHTINT